MICVTVEVCEGAITRRAQFTTSSIEQALKLAGGGKPDRRVRLVFPIDPEAFFVPGDPAPTSTPPPLPHNIPKLGLLPS